MDVVVARIGRPHGVHGECTVEVRTDEPDTRLGPGAVLTTDRPGAGPLVVETARWHSGRLLLTFEGVADRGGVEALRGLVLHTQVDPSARPEDDEEWYDHQLVGMRAVSPDGVDLGEIAEVVHLPAQDVLAVRREGRPDALVPFVAAQVPRVDLQAGQVVIDPAPGLLDLDLAD